MHKDFSYDCFSHTKFGLLRIQGNGVKENPPPRSERVFQIPVQIGLKFSSTVEAFEALVFDLAQVSKLNVVGAGAVSTEGMASNTFSPAMSTTNMFCTTSGICLHTFDFFSMAPLLRFE